MTAYLLVAEYLTAHPRIGEILLSRCKHLSTARKKHSKTNEESSAQNSPGALALRKKLEQGGADGERAVNIQQTNVLYKTRVGYLLSSSQLKIKIKTKFQIAWPPSKSSQRLRLSPKLLLQIQQLPPNHRPVPVLEIWQPSLRKSKLTRGFVHPLKLGTRDIYATLHEPYITKSKQPRKQGHSHDQYPPEISHYNARKRDIIAAICQPPSNDHPTSEIHFRDARCIWQANASSTGPEQSILCYRFIIKNDENMTDSEQCQMILQWEKRGLSTNGNGTPQFRDNEHFVLVAIDRRTRRKSRIAIMNRGGFEITVRERLISDHPRSCLAFPDPVSVGGGTLDSCVDLETWLYTHVLTLGIWVASQEGWLA
ncbi:uncharacterized protein N7479_007410 [Penicillium vulpinum]|uniref:uncharacterized protein n=1 Tax=Penicillium vulpinum TaxID=29845 RepID=UPI002546B109|nr:uncharacterized protein N7479_007410 [Penicillium vulpinum]KAJ5960260.1 hypothetical protein N7479_007410 [Penicillium vulpinum]